MLLILQMKPAHKIKSFINLYSSPKLHAEAF